MAFQFPECQIIPLPARRSHCQF